jgi:hypothetical protein
MTEAEKKKEAFEPVSYERVVDFLMKVDKGDPCAVCGEIAGWAIVAGTTVPDGLTRYVGFSNVDSTGGLYLRAPMAVITCTCNNCGYIRAHEASVIDRRIRELAEQERNELGRGESHEPDAG